MGVSYMNIKGLFYLKKINIAKVLMLGCIFLFGFLFANVKVDAVAKVQVNTTDPGAIQLAMRNFLNKKQPEIMRELQDSLQGNMREIIGTLTLKDICNNRDEFGKQVQSKADEDMRKLGMTIISCNIQNIRDRSGLIEDMGMDNTSKIKKDASIAKAQAERDIAIAQAEADKDAIEQDAMYVEFADEAFEQYCLDNFDTDKDNWKMNTSTLNEKIIGKEKLDSEEAKNILTQYIANITKTALKYIRDDIKDSNEYLLKQIEICNDIIELLKEKLQDKEFEELKISESAEVLTYVYSRMNNTNFNNEIIRPETSISRTSFSCLVLLSIHHLVVLCIHLPSTGTIFITNFYNIVSYKFM